VPYASSVSYVTTVSHVTNSAHLTFFQAIIIGLLQGVTELFPVSSLGHSVLVPALIGGSWSNLVTQQKQADSPYLAFVVALHVATALALLCFFWRDWVRIIGGFISSLRRRRIETVHERLAWLIIVATIPAGVIAIVFEHALRSLFARPEAAAIFLMLNGGLLFAGERLRRRSIARTSAGLDPDAARAVATVDPEHDPENDASVVERVRFRDAGLIGVFQSLALLAGISRSGVTMVAGILRGLDHEQAVRFAFLLATPIILAAGAVKVPTLMGSVGDGIRGQALAGAVAAFLAALVATKFLVRWFKTRTLTPFAWYCGVFGAFCVVYFA
jgi:undecaprenyl-diphosphatase